MGVNELVQIGTRIKELRLKRGLKQKELADKVQIPYSTFANYENNKREPNQEQIEKIAEALGVTSYNLLGISTEQLLQPLKNEVKFLNYLSSLGYEYVDTFLDNDYGYDRCIHIISENKDIPLTKEEYENLKREYLQEKKAFTEDVKSLKQKTSCISRK